jgi:Rrf2 family protein
MRISTTTHYASRLLLNLALHADAAPIPASKLSEHTGIPVKFVEKLVRPLKAAGFVKSVRGATGGHYLGCQPDDITLGSVVRLMDGGIRLSQCGVNGRNCRACHECRSREIWLGVTEKLERELDSITLADMLGSRRLVCQHANFPDTEAKRNDVD